MVNQSQYMAVIEAWNRMAEDHKAHNIPKAFYDTPKYFKALRARWKETEFREQWEEAMAAVPKHPFYMGKNERGWKANFEWFLRPGQTTKILSKGVPVGKGDWGCEAGQEAPF